MMIFVGILLKDFWYITFPGLFGTVFAFKKYINTKKGAGGGMALSSRPLSWARSIPR